MVCSRNLSRGGRLGGCRQANRILWYGRAAVKGKHRNILMQPRALASPHYPLCETFPTPSILYRTRAGALRCQRRANGGPDRGHGLPPRRAATTWRWAWGTTPLRIHGKPGSSVVPRSPLSPPWQRSHASALLWCRRRVVPRRAPPFSFI